MIYFAAVLILAFSHAEADVHNSTLGTLAAQSFPGNYDILDVVASHHIEPLVYQAIMAAFFFSLGMKYGARRDRITREDSTVTKCIRCWIGIAFTAFTAFTAVIAFTVFTVFTAVIAKPVIAASCFIFDKCFYIFRVFFTIGITFAACLELIIIDMLDWFGRLFRIERLKKKSGYYVTPVFATICVY